MIWPAVVAIFLRWNWQFEGLAFCMYADILGLPTTGVGNLLPEDVALILPWKHPDGTAATKDEISAAWHLINKNMEAAKKGADYACTLTDLRLSMEAVEALVEDRLEQNAEFLTNRFPDFPDWPADAQLATLSMAWAMGPAFDFPKFEEAVQSWDFHTAALESKINAAGNPGVVPRNSADLALFNAAAVKVANGGDYSELTFDYSNLRDGRTFGQPAPGGAADSAIPWTAVAVGAALGLAGLAVFVPGALPLGELVGFFAGRSTRGRVQPR